jgi:hypothetical protein
MSTITYPIIARARIAEAVAAREAYLLAVHDAWRWRNKLRVHEVAHGMGMTLDEMYSLVQEAAPYVAARAKQY